MNTALSIVLFILYTLAAVFATLFIIHVTHYHIKKYKSQTEMIKDIRDQILDLKTQIALMSINLDDIKRTLGQPDK